MPIWQESLAAQKEGSVDKALRVALRIIEECAVLVEKMADDSGEPGATAGLTLAAPSAIPAANAGEHARSRGAAHQSHPRRFWGVSR